MDARLHLAPITRRPPFYAQPLHHLQRISPKFSVDLNFSSLRSLMANPLLFLALLLPLAATAHFVPTDNLLLACGSSSAYSLPDHRLFLPDSPSPRPSLTAASPHPSPNLLSHSARIFNVPASYSFRLKSPSPHILRLHFYPFPTPSTHLSSAAFHVSLNNFVLLTNFTPSAASIKEFIVPAAAGRSLHLSFTPASPSTFAFVNAIELISAPSDLISDVARLVSQNYTENFYGITNKALETVHRINVGGPKVTPFNDTLWRTWSPDASTDGAVVSFSGRIMYRKYGASREVAPDSVYASARVTRSEGAKLEWAFPVRAGFRYLVRMHFCDIASMALNELYFNVYVNGYVAYEDLDLSEAAGQVLASPYYADFAVDADGSGVLNVTITPSKMTRPLRIGGLLNGVEIMKMSNERGSLDGEIPVLSVMESPRKRITLGTFVSSVLCGVVFMSLSAVVFMLMMRLRSESGSRVGWSPLPVDAPEGNNVRMNNMMSGKFVYF